MMAFPTLVPEKFLDFVEEQRPRALAILAYFFALCAGMENLVSQLSESFIYILT